MPFSPPIDFPHALAFAQAQNARFQALLTLGLSPEALSQAEIERLAALATLYPLTPAEDHSARMWETRSARALLFTRLACQALMRERALPGEAPRPTQVAQTMTSLLDLRELACGVNAALAQGEPWAGQGVSFLRSRPGAQFPLSDPAPPQRPALMAPVIPEGSKEHHGYCVMSFSRQLSGLARLGALICAELPELDQGTALAGWLSQALGLLDRRGAPLAFSDGFMAAGEGADFERKIQALAQRQALGSSLLLSPRPTYLGPERRRL